MDLVYRFSFDPIVIDYPPGHEFFLNSVTAEEPGTSAVFDRCNLRVADFTPPIRSNKEPICINEIWELWGNPGEGFTFIGARNKPPVYLEIERDFSRGVAYGEFTTKSTRGFYAFQGVEMTLFVNWLAKSSDLILHASGVAIEDKGYAFIGHSGAGKSTLVDTLSQESGIRVLGEDQVILRYLDNRFWIFGTPWHDSTKMCSPVGVPLEKLFFLDRGNSRTLTQLPRITQVTEIMQTAFIPYYRKDCLPAILDRLSILSGQVPAFTLAYQLGSDILPVILNA